MMLYTINLEVRVLGPEDEWDVVAERLVRKMKGLKSPGGYTVESVAIDTAEDLPEES